ncbi:MAG: Maf family protein [Candidatus Lokiarchaeota archaeon]|nr:Maf family protein [Candidatus Lokiarchaeota archaeon]
MIDCFVLGSKSPDRKALMEASGLVPLVVLPGDYPEREEDEVNNPARLAEILAAKKAQNVFDKLRLAIKREGFVASLPIPAGAGTATLVLVTADTVVSLKSEVIGKAEDEDEAFSILRRLQGQTHKLVTAYCLKAIELDAGAPSVREIAARAGGTATRVKFAPLDSEQVRAYVATGEWRGRAGCYAIQLQASRFVRAIEGSHSGVVGLPVAEVVDDLRAMGLDL